MMNRLGNIFVRDFAVFGEITGGRIRDMAEQATLEAASRASVNLKRSKGKRQS
jgi:hypothetical protein